MENSSDPNNQSYIINNIEIPLQKFKRFLPKDIYGNEITYSTVKSALNQTYEDPTITERNSGF